MDLIGTTQASRALICVHACVALCNSIPGVDSCNHHYKQDIEQRSLLLSLYSNAIPCFSFLTSPPPQTLATTNLFSICIILSL